jgi:uncharacterized membrane protein YccC
VSKQRSIDRLKGSFLGGILGLVSIFFITNVYVLLGIMLIYMLLTFTFLRNKYVYGTFFLTAFFLIAYYFFTGVNDFGVLLLKERLLDTIIGCVLSFLSFHLILPTWESDSVKNYLKNVIQANIHFLSVCFHKMSGDQIDIADYKLARKEIYLTLAELNALNERILNEPQYQRPFTKELNDFSIFSHQLISYAMALTTKLDHSSDFIYHDEHQRLMNMILSKLKKSYTLFAADTIDIKTLKTPGVKMDVVDHRDATLIREQLELMLGLVDKLNHTSLDISLLAKRSI